MFSRQVPLPLVLLVLGVVPHVRGADNPRAATNPDKVLRGDTVELADKVQTAQPDGYQLSLIKLRAHCIAVGDYQTARQVEADLNNARRLEYNKPDLESPAPPPKASDSLVDADLLYNYAVRLKDKGSAEDLCRAEEVFQRLLNKYPSSDRVCDTVYQLGEIYESSQSYHRAALYFERCFEWDRKTKQNARLRAARLYETKLNDRGKAMDLYKEVTTHEIDNKRVEEAKLRLQELGAKK